MQFRLSIFMFFILVTSCRTVKQYNDQEIKTNTACAELMFEERIPLITIEIDGVKTKFMFDTGATSSYLTDTTVIRGFGSKKFANLGSAKTANGEKIKKRTIQVTFNSALFESNNKVISVIQMPPNKCSKAAKTFSGILGLDVFFEEKACVKLDFGNSKVCNIAPEEAKLFVLQDQYVEIKSAFKYKRLYVFLTIEGKEYKFQLDTGFIGSIVLPYREGLKFNSDDKQELEGSMYTTASSISRSSETLYEKIPIKLGNETLKARINVSGSITSQNIGIEFIKGFNWIIDYANSKIYIKRNSNNIESEFNRRTVYSVNVQNDKLKIVIKEKSQTKYHLGDEIISVNGQKVTPQNNCEMQDLLNKTEDWNTLQLEVVPSAK